MANTNRSDIHELFLQLVRLGIGAETVQDVQKFKSLSPEDWQQLKDLADSQGLSAVVLDGLNTDSTNLTDTMPLQMKLEWIGETLQSESVYVAQWKAACDMAQVFEANGIRTYVLKGFVVAECYPKPEHRVSVDMDCFLIPHKGDFDAWELGNQLMEHAGFEVDRSFYKNSTIMLPGLTVENHQFMTAVRGSKRLKNLERYLQSWILEDTEQRRFDGTCMYRPPVMVSALFLIEHAYAHFLHEGLTWRMVLDWVMLSKKHQKEIDWYALDALVEDFGFKRFYDSFSLLGKYLIGEGQEVQSLSVQDQSMLKDVWAPLDLHEFHGVKGKIALAGNEIRAAWKYKYFSPDTMIGDLFNRVRGFLFERHPRI